MPITFFLLLCPSFVYIHYLLFALDNSYILQILLFFTIVIIIFCKKIWRFIFCVFKFYLLLIYHSTFSFVKSSFGDLLYFEPFVFCKVNFYPLLIYINFFKLYTIIFLTFLGLPCSQQFDLLICFLHCCISSICLYSKFQFLYLHQLSLFLSLK